MNVNYNFNRDESEYVNNLLSMMLDNVDKEISIRENMIRFFANRSPVYDKEKIEEDVDKIINGVANFQRNFNEAKREYEEKSDCKENSEETVKNEDIVKSEDKVNNENEVKSEDEVKSEGEEKSECEEKSIDKEKENAKNAAWLFKKLEQATKGLTNEQKYECMYYLLIGLKAVDYNVINEISTTEDLDTMVKIEELRSSIVMTSEGTISDDDINELKTLMVEAIEHAGICIAGNKELIDLIKHLPEDKEAVNGFISSNWDDVEFKEYASLATYIAYLEGALPSMPAGIDPELIATSVTAGIERDKIIKEASLGQVTFEYACQILKIIGAIVLFGFMLWLSIKVLAALVLLGGGIGFVIGESLISLIIGMALGGYLGYKASEGIISVGSEVMDAAGDGYDKAVQIITTTYTKLSDYIKENMIDPLKEKHDNFYDYINNKVMDGIIRVKTARAEQNNPVEVFSL
jgi:hypothetical protein